MNDQPSLHESNVIEFPAAAQPEAPVEDLGTLVARAEELGLDVVPDTAAANPGTVEELAAVREANAQAVESKGDDPDKTLPDLPDTMMKFFTDFGIDVQTERDAENRRLSALRATELQLLQRLEKTLTASQFAPIPMSLMFFQLLMTMKFTLLQLTEAGQLKGTPLEVVSGEFDKINNFANHYIGSTIGRAVLVGDMTEEAYKVGPAADVNTVLEIKAAIFNAMYDDQKRLARAVMAAQVAAQARMAAQQTAQAVEAAAPAPTPNPVADAVVGTVLSLVPSAAANDTAVQTDGTPGAA